MAFTHLHVHTEYSLLDGSNKIKEYVARVKELGMDSAAITDHGVMYGVIDFYRAAKAAGINPILGCEVYVAPGSRFDREIGSGDDRYYHLVLLAENNQGYQNLMKIVSKSFKEGFYYKPRVDLELLREYHEGLIALSACLAGEVARFLNRGMYPDAKKAALRYQEIFGEGNFFLELQDHGIPEQQNVNQQLLRMHQETGIDLVATNDIHYTYKEDADPHDILLCLQTGKKLSDTDRMRYEGGQYYVKSEQEMAALFPYALEALENTHKIAERCHVEIEFGVTKLPRFDVPEGYTSWEYLNKLCFEGLERLYDPVTPELRERLEYELNTIKNMGYVDYFLIVWDFIHYARSNGIEVGPGRGSAAGSIVAYTLGITLLDPIKYDLLFERFLNPERVSMPDIDVDFGFERRQEVIDYVVRKYGKDCVVQIVTFGTLAARGVIRDVGRVLDMPYAQVDSIAKMVPAKIPNVKLVTIDKAMEVNPELKKAYDEQPDVHHLIDMAKRLEGLPRHTSMHAAGVVISQKDVSEYVPLSRAQDGTIVTQFVMTTLEELGLLKMDFLGLRTLTVINNAVKNVKKNYGISLDMQKINYNDQKVLEYNKSLIEATNLMNNMVSRHYTCAIRIRMSDKIQRLPVKFVDSTPVGQILEQMTDDVSAMGTSIHQIVDTLMQGLLQIALIAVALLMEDWRLGLIVLATTPISMLLSVVISNASEKYYHKMFQEGAQLYSIVEEGYTNFSTTKAYNLEQAMVEKHQKVNRRQRKVQAQAAFVSGLVQPMIVLANALTYIAVNLVGGYLIVKGRLPVGTVVTVILFARQFSAPLEQISEGLSQMQRTTAAARRVFHLLELPEEDPRQGQVQPEEVQGRVEFRHVSFSYDPKQPLIRDLSFTAEPGQTIAIVGPTGAGKTTIVNLLMGFYDISAGEILIDGRSLEDMNRDEARELFAMVLQETWLKSGTIRDNIAYGKPDATDEEIIRAAKEAHAHSFIKRMPEGYNTVITEDGGNLSQGQKQLLCIARVMLCLPPMLILDEATSSIDTRTEIRIQKAFATMMKGRTSFIVAHRLSTIREADVILVMRDGHIIEQGNHESLLAKNGFYAQLYNSQFAVS